MQLVDGLAKIGRGASEFISEKESMEEKVMSQLRRALQPELSNVTVGFNGNCNLKFVPEKLDAVWEGEKCSLFGFSDEKKVSWKFP